MMRFLLLASAGLAAAESDHVSLLQTTVSKVEQHVAPALGDRAACKAAKAKARESRAAMKAAREAFKNAKATFRTDRAAIKDACPKKDKKPRTPKLCGKGYTHAPGYVNGQGNVAWIEVITKAARHQIGNHGGSDGKGPCNANPGGQGPHFGRQRVAGVLRDPFYDCSEDPEHEYNLLFCENLKEEYKPYAAKISLGQQCVFCFAPICEKLCSDRPDCKSFEARISEGACELNTQTGPDRFPTWYKPGHGQNQTVPVPENYQVPGDSIFCVKSEFYQG